MYSASQYGGGEYLIRIAPLAVIRSVGPSHACSAVTLALVGWAHGLTEDQLRTRQRALFGRALAATVFVEPVIVVLTLTFSGALFLTVFRIAPSTFVSTGLLTLSRDDFAIAPVVLVMHVIFTIPVCWFALPALAKRRWGLAAKFTATWFALWLLHIPMDFAFNAAFGALFPAVPS